MRKISLSNETNLDIKQKLARVFDDNLKTRQWLNVVDWIIIVLIVISTVEVFLSTFDGISERYGVWLNVVDLLTTVLFTVEVTLRIWCADLISDKYKGFWGRVRYCCTFYGFIDFISTYSFYLALFFPVPYAVLKVLRVFRLLRVFRYMKSFDVVSRAFRSKKSEMWISLQFLCIVTLILSFLLFFVEHQAQPEVYDNGWRSVLWAFAQYIGDPGNFADTPPITFWGRVIAVLVGVLGIAIFAVPAGLIGSGFIETIEEDRREKELKEKREMIYQRFEAYHNKKVLLCDEKHQRTAPTRYMSTEAIRSVCMLADNEILEAVRSTDDMRLRSMKSDESQRINDITVVERFLSGESYGYCRWNDNERMVLLNTSGAVEPGVSHIFATLAENYNYYNVISREKRFYGAANEDGINDSPSYATMEAEDKNPIFEEYLGALKQIKRGQRVLYIQSGSSGRTDFEVQWGMPTGTEGYQFDGAHVAEEDREWVEQFCEQLRKNAAEITVKAPSRKEFTFNFTFSMHNKACLGLKDTHIARAIYNHTGATVLMVYLNVQTVLKATNERYYAALKVLMDTLDEIG